MNKQDEIYTCHDHVDMGIDDYVNSKNKAPDIIKISSNKRCNYCNKEAVYKIYSESYI
jgi:CxxH/CxxC protein (TIGR04129 family)